MKSLAKDRHDKYDFRVSEKKIQRKHIYKSSLVKRQIKTKSTSKFPILSNKSCVHLR